MCVCVCVFVRVCVCSCGNVVVEFPTTLYTQFRVRPHSSSKVEHLEQRLDDLETLRKYCGSKMDSQLGKGELRGWCTPHIGGVVYTF